MTIENVRKAMMIELDWGAQEFIHYKEPHAKQDVAHDFKLMTKHYNTVLKNLSSEGVRMEFPHDIIKYIKQRKAEGWKMIG